MDKNVFSKKELLIFKDYCIDMLNLFSESDMIEKNETIFLNNVKSLEISEDDIIHLMDKIDNIL